MKPNDFWYTPPLILDVVQEVLGLYFDPCPIDPKIDGLRAEWGRYCFINPPYSRDLKRAFIDAAIEKFNPNSDRYIWLMNYANSKDMEDIKRRSSAVCLPGKRVKFLVGHPDLQESSPRYDNIILLWGNTTGFEKFKKIGDVFYA